MKLLFIHTQAFIYAFHEKLFKSLKIHCFSHSVKMSNRNYKLVIILIILVVPVLTQRSKRMAYNYRLI